MKRSIDDSDLTLVPSSPSKRPRVKFDADVDIVSADEEDDVDPLLVNEQVRRAIERHLAYDHESYERIRSLFTIEPEKERAPSSKVLKCHINALEANVTKLRKECGSLVQSVLSSEWVGRDDSYVTAFVRFLGSLAVTQGGFVNSMVSMLVDLLGPQSTRRIPGSKVVRQPKIYRRVLETLRHLTQLNPMASSILAQRVSSKLDFDFRKRKDRMTFVENAMQLIQYTPEVTSEILNSVLQQLIKLDAGIQADLEDDDDATDELLEHMTSSQTLVFQQKRRLSQASSSDDDTNTSISDDSDSEDDEELTEAEARRRQLKDDIRQVDEIMNILFEYYAELMNSNNLETQDNAIEQLIAQFNQFVLPTFRSRHPQFIIFHFAQTNPVRVDRFITNCITRVVDTRHPPVIRHQAAAYFSGFLGRAKHVSGAFVQECLDLFCSEMDKIRVRYETTCTQPDLNRYGDFYVMFQAVMYVFCFRWNDLDISEPGTNDDGYPDNEDYAQYKLPDSIQQTMRSAIFSPLNPLRVCTPGIVAQFAEITHRLQIFYLYTKLAENKRVRVATHWRSVADLSLAGPDRDTNWMGDNGMLEAYYPYDPYHLPISRQWLVDDYLEWRGSPGDENEDEDSEIEVGDEEYDLLPDIAHTAAVDSDDA